MSETRRRLPIGGKRLIRCAAKFRDGFAPKITLFPFFAGDGEIVTCVLLDESLGEVRVLLNTQLVHIPWSGALKFDTGWLALPLLENASAIERAWHFDPEWLLDGPTFRHHPLREALKTTNCFGQFPWNTPNIYFRGNLQSVKWVHKHSNDEQKLTPYQPHLLPVAQAQAETSVALPGQPRWVLSPIWERNI